MNSKPSYWLGTVVAALAAVSLSSTALASSHREAPAISTDPSADNTDLWAWMSPDWKTLHVVASYIPMEEPSGGPNFNKFSDSVLYTIHVTDPGVALTDGGATYDLNDVVTYNIKFTTSPVLYVAPGDAGSAVGGGQEFFSQLSGETQTYTVTKIDKSGTSTVLTGATAPSVAPPNIGPRTNVVAYQIAGDGGYAAYANSFTASLSNGGQVWAGPRDDGFYVDLGGIFDLANLRAKGTAQDGVAGFNVHSISLDIPATDIFGSNGVPHTGTAGDDSTVGVWASASRKKIGILRNDGTTSAFGPWVQVSRLGLPLINEAVIGIQDKDKYNRTQPATDLQNFAGYFLAPVIVRDAEAVGIYTALGVTGAAYTPFTENRTDIVTVINLDGPLGHHIGIAPGVTGDVLRVDAAAASWAFPNGRPLWDSAQTDPNQKATAKNQEPLSAVGLNTTDTILTLALGSNAPLFAASFGTKAWPAAVVQNHVDNNDANFPGVFPWLAQPWRGYDQGHGKVPSSD